MDKINLRTKNNKVIIFLIAVLIIISLINLPGTWYQIRKYYCLIRIKSRNPHTRMQAVCDLPLLALEKLNDELGILDKIYFNEKDNEVKKTILNEIHLFESSLSFSLAPGISRWIYDEDEGVRSGGIIALGRSFNAMNDFRVQERLLLASIDKSHEVRERVSQALSVFNYPWVVPTLQKLSKDEDVNVRLYAAKSLCRLGNKSGIPVLIDCLKEVDTKMSKQIILSTLETYTGQKFEEEIINKWNSWWEKDKDKFQIDLAQVILKGDMKNY